MGSLPMIAFVHFPTPDILTGSFLGQVYCNVAYVTFATSPLHIRAGEYPFRGKWRSTRPSSCSTLYFLIPSFGFSANMQLEKCCPFCCPSQHDNLSTGCTPGIDILSFAALLTHLRSLETDVYRGSRSCFEGHQSAQSASQRLPSQIILFRFLTRILPSSGMILDAAPHMAGRLMQIKQIISSSPKLECS